ncbi:MAG TPA: PEP-utilizing enzyme [Kofleriaceae bacterium]|jgi:pyruvate,water dikinase|nr:PEP-utilizing enzyme [Kofleriaceae bacterium]
MWLHELARADARCGGKAAGLAKLIAAGLPVPPGFAISSAAFDHVAQLAGGELDHAGHAFEQAAARIEAAQPDFVAEVRARAAALGHVIVRSSATIEDGASGAAPGVFESIREPGDVWAAVRAVWLAALAPLAAAYARRRSGEIHVGVIVQAIAPGELVTIYTRPPGAPNGDELIVQRGAQLARASRETPGALGAIALAAEAAIGAEHGADIELVGDWIVQARPIVHPTKRVRIAPPEIVVAALRDGRVWTWDVAHNPDPLSPAQAGLVERVERAKLGAYELRMCGGYLYATPRAGFTPPIVTNVRAQAAAITAKLDAALSADASAIERYIACYAIWADELSPLVAAARSATHARRASAVEVTLARAARGELSFDDVLARLGDLAPAWDVSVPSFGETPQILRDAIANARTLAASDDDSDAAFVADLAERDDIYFARMQQLVRRELLARGLGDDVFWLPLDIGEIDPIDARRRAAAARAARSRAAEWDMPFVVGGEPVKPGRALHGVGGGPRVTGRAVRFASLAAAMFARRGDVVIVRAVTPALAMFAGRCAAIVSETGGLLDHGAALARELGITYVVGCYDAWHALDDGAIITVDGDAGVVYSSSS